MSEEVHPKFKSLVGLFIVPSWLKIEVPIETDSLEVGVIQVKDATRNYILKNQELRKKIEEVLMESISDIEVKTMSLSNVGGSTRSDFADHMFLDLSKGKVYQLTLKQSFHGRKRNDLSHRSRENVKEEDTSKWEEFDSQQYCQYDVIDHRHNYEAPQNTENHSHDNNDNFPDFSFTPFSSPFHEDDKKKNEKKIEEEEKFTFDGRVGSENDTTTIPTHETTNTSTKEDQFQFEFKTVRYELENQEDNLFGLKDPVDSSQTMDDLPGISDTCLFRKKFCDSIVTYGNITLKNEKLELDEGEGEEESKKAASHQEEEDEGVQISIFDPEKKVVLKSKTRLFVGKKRITVGEVGPGRKMLSIDNKFGMIAIGCSFGVYILRSFDFHFLLSSPYLRFRSVNLRMISKPKILIHHPLEIRFDKIFNHVGVLFVRNANGIFLFDVEQKLQKNKAGGEEEEEEKDEEEDYFDYWKRKNMLVFVSCKCIGEIQGRFGTFKISKKGSLFVLSIEDGFLFDCYSRKTKTTGDHHHPLKEKDDDDLPKIEYETRRVFEEIDDIKAFDFLYGGKRIIIGSGSGEMYFCDPALHTILKKLKLGATIGIRRLDYICTENDIRYFDYLLDQGKVQSEVLYFESENSDCGILNISEVNARVTLYPGSAKKGDFGFDQETEELSTCIALSEGKCRNSVVISSTRSSSLRILLSEHYRSSREFALVVDLPEKEDETKNTSELENLLWSSQKVYNSKIEKLNWRDSLSCFEEDSVCCGMAFDQTCLKKPGCSGSEIIFLTSDGFLSNGVCSRAFPPLLQNFDMFSDRREFYCHAMRMSRASMQLPFGNFSRDWFDSIGKGMNAGCVKIGSSQSSIENIADQNERVGFLLDLRGDFGGGSEFLFGSTLSKVVKERSSSFFLKNRLFVVDIKFLRSGVTIKNIFRSFLHQ